MAPIIIPPDDPGDHGKDDGVVTVAGNVEITNDVGNAIPVSGPLTDAELRATAVPVSGTVTANAGTNLNTSALALSATQTDGTQLTQITDGANEAAVKAASTAAVAADPALVVSLSPNSTGEVNVHTESYGGLLHGQNSDIDSGANEQIVAASNVAVKGVLVKALASNTGTIYIGGSGVTAANGIPLAAGESITIPVANANQVYAIASVDNQALAWMAS